MIVGSPRIEYVNKMPHLKNSAFFLSSSGKILQHYDKIHLVPFGEYLPMKKLLSYMGSVVNEVGEFSPGKQFTHFTLDEIKLKEGTKVETAHKKNENSYAFRFGVVICYEIIFPSLFRKFINPQTDFMINITNDAWYGKTSAPYQHFSMAVFRAIENGRGIVRVANTGISGFIDPVGRIVIATPLFSRTALVKKFPLTKISTFYSLFGDFFSQSCVILTVLFSFITLWRQKNIWKKP